MEAAYTDFQGMGTPQTRFIVWRNSNQASRKPIRGLLSRFANVRVVRSDDPDSAVVMTDEITAQKLRSELDCHVEQDVQFRMAR